jgi:hypothetical protein
VSGHTFSAMPRLDSRTRYTVHNRYAVHQGLLDWSYTHTAHESCSEGIAGHEKKNNMIAMARDDLLTWCLYECYRELSYHWKHNEDGCMLSEHR